MVLLFIFRIFAGFVGRLGRSFGWFCFRNVGSKAFVYFFFLRSLNVNTMYRTGFWGLGSRLGKCLVCLVSNFIFKFFSVCGV